jgi:hypothetical protein
MQDDRAGERRDAGVLFYAIGAQYLDEAVASACSVRACMPDLPLALITDGTPPETLFDMVLPPQDGIGFKAQKMAALKRSPFEKTLYLDTDTFMAAPVPELFEALDNYDMAMALSVLQRLNDRYRGIPECAPVWNAGVIAFRRSEPVLTLFDRWLALHGDDTGQDQPPLRQAMYESDLRCLPLTNSYNYKLEFPQPLAHDVKILHGRHPHLEKLARTLRAERGVVPILPIFSLHRARIIGKKTLRPRIGEWLKEGLKLLPGGSSHRG